MPDPNTCIGWWSTQLDRSRHNSQGVPCGTGEVAGAAGWGRGSMYVSVRGCKTSLMCGWCIRTELAHGWWGLNPQLGLISQGGAHRAHALRHGAHSGTTRMLEGALRAGHSRGGIFSCDSNLLCATEGRACHQLATRGTMRGSGCWIVLVGSAPSDRYSGTLVDPCALLLWGVSSSCAHQRRTCCYLDELRRVCRGTRVCGACACE